MNRHARLSLATASLLLLPAALTAQEVQTVEPPKTRPVPGSGPTLIVYSAAGLRCEDGAVTAVDLVAPFGSAQGTRFENIADTELSFRIDADGRARGIEKKGPRYSWPMNEDAEPALAASRFATGKPQAHCSVRYVATSVPFAEATPAQLATAWVVPHNDKSQDRALWKALQPAGGDCYVSRLRPAVVRYPDYKQLPERAGLPDYAVVRFDVDKRGKSIAVQTLVSSGNPAFDKSVATAASGTAFEAGSPRTGCIARYGKGPRTPLAVPAREGERFKPDEACKDEPKWKVMPPLLFPPNFSRRAIQGWAVVRFDVAPWGAVGNVKVLASEPADEFGFAARAIVETAQKPSSDRGYSGCIQAVSFKIADHPVDIDGAVEATDIAS